MKKILTCTLMMILVMVSLTACRREPYTDVQLNEWTEKVDHYLENKYPEHDFTVTAEDELHSGMGLPTHYELEIKAEDENGKEFKVWCSSSQEDPLILQFFVKHCGDNYGEE